MRIHQPIKRHDCEHKGRLYLAVVGEKGLQFQPNCFRVGALLGWAGAPVSVSAQRRWFVRSVFENEWVWAATRVQRQGHGPEQSPVRGTSFLASVSRLQSHCFTPSITPLPPPHSIFSRFPATFLPVFLCMEWRPVASARGNRNSWALVLPRMAGA